MQVFKLGLIGSTVYSTWASIWSYVDGLSCLLFVDGLSVRCYIESHGQQSALVVLKWTIQCALL